MSSLLIVGEGDVLCGNTVWQEKQEETADRVWEAHHTYM